MTARKHVDEQNPEAVESDKSNRDCRQQNVSKSGEQQSRRLFNGSAKQILSLHAAELTAQLSLGRTSATSPERLHSPPAQIPITSGDSAESVRQAPLDNRVPPHRLVHAESRRGAFHDLHDEQVFESSRLRVLHTPGHTRDSICLHIPQDNALYTADTVLGQGTAVFEDLAAYITSLRAMLAFAKAEGAGTGWQLRTGRRRRRLWRRLRRGRAAAGESGSHPWTLVAMIYAAYLESLWLPAARGVALHLEKLEGEGVVRRIGGEGKDTSWEFVSE
ncbi:beta-lactamase-like protein [Mycena sanguinolenta]|nr:beta-lactamase-like protein [Mycena sanguinolenta]